jgi:hypothetical protein
MDVNDSPPQLVRLQFPSTYSQCLRSLSCALLLALAIQSTGCNLGPRAVYEGRLHLNEAVKSTSEQQLLLNIVRLRYTDSPSSLALSSIADQRELVGNLGLVPFFTSAAAGDIGSYRGSALPTVGFSGATRPTLSYTPMDDQEFTRRLFTPISLEGTACVKLQRLLVLHR